MLGAIVVGGCTGADDLGDGGGGDDPVVVQPGAPGEAGEVLDGPTQVPDQPYSTIDVAFLHAMIPHHEQALAMTALVPDRAERADLPVFARRIELSQQAEIDQMADWLAARGEPLTAEDHPEHGPAGLAPGMLTEAQLTELAQTRGAAFDRLFLESMIAHHEGALRMVEDLLAAGGAQEATLFDIVSSIEADQRIEIDRMTALLAGLDG